MSRASVQRYGCVCRGRRWRSRGLWSALPRRAPCPRRSGSCARVEGWAHLEGKQTQTTRRQSHTHTHAQSKYTWCRHGWQTDTKEDTAANSQTDQVKHKQEARKVEMVRQLMSRLNPHYSSKSECRQETVTDGLCHNPSTGNRHMIFSVLMMQYDIGKYKLHVSSERVFGHISAFIEQQRVWQSLSTITDAIQC